MWSVKYCSRIRSSKLRSLRSGSSVTCSKSQRSAAPDALVAFEAGRRIAAADERRDDVVAVDGELPDRESRLCGQLAANARFESLVAAIALRQPAPANVGMTNANRRSILSGPTRRMKRRSPASLNCGIRRIHVLTDQVLGRLNDLVREAKALEHRSAISAPDDLVAIKVRPRLGAGLADVVKQSRQA